MIGFNGTYLDQASLGEYRITAAAIGGQWVIAPWHIAPATQQAIVAAFGAEEGKAVIKATNDYLNAIAATDTARAQQMAAFINEDPMLVCSLVETSKVRWLVGDGKAYIKTELCPSYDNKLSTIFVKTRNADECVLGARNGSTKKGFIIAPLVAGTYGSWFSETNSMAKWDKNIKQNQITHVEMSKNGIFMNGAKISTQTTPLVGNDYNIDGYFFIFATSEGTVLESLKRIFGGMIKYVNIDIAHFIPMQRTDDTCGMLDIISCTFYPNANTSGSFTIQLTPKTTS